MTMKQKVLVVEDDANSRYMMNEMLDELGLETVEAHDGASAVQTALDHRDSISLILMDIHMPKKSGVSATEEIRQLINDPPAGLPIIAVTADQSWVERANSQMSGFNAGLSKPVGFSKLRASIEHYVSI